MDQKYELNYKKENLFLLFSTTGSLIVAWSWNNFFQSYIKTYYGTSLSLNFIVATIITIVIFLFVYWTLRHFGQRRYYRQINRDNTRGTARGSARS